MLARLPVSSLLVVLATAAGCAPQLDTELLQLDEVRPDRIEPGTRLTVRGAGFPPGRTARLELVGIMHRPGHPPTETRVRGAARLLADDLAEVRVDASWIEQLGGRGTFHGEARLVVPAKRGGTVSGRRRGLTIDVVPPASVELKDRLGRLRAARRTLHALGLRVGPEDPERGLLVRTVASPSPAADAGIAPGDRLVALDGVRLMTVADLVPAPGRAPLSVRLARPGQAGLSAVEVERSSLLSSAASPAAAAGIGDGDADPERIVTTLLIVLAIWTLAMPVARRVAERLGASLGELRARWSRRAVLDALVAAVALSLLAPLFTLPVHAGLVLAALLALRGAVVSLGDASERPRTVAMDLVPAAALLIGCAVRCGGFSLSDLSEAQGAMPWRWTGFADPVTFPLLWVAPLTRLASVRPSSTGLTRTLELGSAVLFVGLVVTTLGGGGASTLPGALAFAAKGLFFLGLGALARRETWHGAARWVITSSVGSMGVALALVFLEAPLDRSWVMGVGLFSATLVTSVLVTVSRLRSAPRALEVQPFL